MGEFFTLNHSLNDILNNERVNKKLHLLFSPRYYEQVGTLARKMKLKHMVKFSKTSWGSPFPAEGLLHCANFLISRREAGELTSISIWRDEEGTEDVVLIPFLHKDKKNAPCVIVCPGGAYNCVAFHNEGIPVGEELFNRGYQVLVLNYRVRPNLYPKPEQDLVRAIRFVRANHEKLGVNPDDVTIMGFSAGGHLCGCVGALYDHIEDPTHRYDHISARPNKICLGYGALSFLEEGEIYCRQYHLGEDANEEKCRTLSVEMLTSKDYPKTFIWACEDDPVVSVKNSKQMAESLKNKNADFEMKIYPSGGHGIGPAKGTSACGWIDDMEAFFEGTKE